MIETKEANVSVTNPRGNASKGALRYRLQIPVVWMRKMGVTTENKNVLLTFDGGKITIKKI